jgi:hypothetical protein
MRNRLLVLRCLTHDPQSILTAIYRLALVGIELRSHFGFRIIFRGLTGLKLKIATFTDADGNWSTFYEPQVALLHNCSLAHLLGRT